MPSALDAYPLSQHYIDRSLRDERHVRASGNTPAEREHTNQHIRAASGVTGKLNVNGDLQVKNLGKMRAGQTAYDTGIGWFFGYNGNTPVFSIGDSSPGANKMLWDGTDLTIVGDLSATTGEIGGWSIGTSQLTGGDATLDSAGFIELGTGDDIAKLSSVDATYRLWIGDATPADAPFSVQKNGNFFAGDAAGRTKYVEWDGSSLTVRGRFEFGTGDFLDNDILHFDLPTNIANVIEMANPANGIGTQGSTFRARANAIDTDVAWSVFDDQDLLNLDVEISLHTENDGELSAVVFSAGPSFGIDGDRATVLARSDIGASRTEVEVRGDRMNIQSSDIDIGTVSTTNIDLTGDDIILLGANAVEVEAPALILDTGTGDAIEFECEQFTSVGTEYRDIQVQLNGVTCYLRTWTH